MVIQSSFFGQRSLVWFSCGVASACAAKLAVEHRRDDRLQVLYCDTLKYEHPDNIRFLRSVEEWLQWPITILAAKQPEYCDEDGKPDIYRVFDSTGWLVGPQGARCTTELKKNVRKGFQYPDDVHVFGLCADEASRIAKFRSENPELLCEWNLYAAGYTKAKCKATIREAGIELPALYRMGYKNNNCIGCVKGQMGYWNKIRVDYPDAFARMAAQERKMGIAICKRYDGNTRIPVFLDELRPDQGNYGQEPDIECGPQCVNPELDNAELSHAPSSVAERNDEKKK